MDGEGRHFEDGRCSAAVVTQNAEELGELRCEEREDTVEFSDGGNDRKLGGADCKLVTSFVPYCTDMIRLFAEVDVDEGMVPTRGAAGFLGQPLSAIPNTLTP
jgi:hypothetical protein